MTTPVRRDAVTLVRARDVVAYWRDDRLVVANFMAGTRAAAPAVAVRVLELCGTPQTVPAILRALPEFRRADVRRLIGALRRVRLLEPLSQPRGRDRSPDWAAWNPAGGFFHFTTKDVPFPKSPQASSELWRRFGPAGPMPSPVKRVPGARRLSLPARDVSDAFSQVLLSRRTWREFARTPVPLESLATVLRMTWGVQRWASVGGQGKVALKTSPSGGARHAGEVYVLARRVDGLAPGLYHFEAATGLLAALPKRRPMPSVATLLPGQPWYRDAPVLFIMTAVFARAQWRYAFPRAYRAVLIEAGHLCQTCCLVATSLGLAPFCSMAFPDSRVEAMLGIDGVHESAIYIAGMGVRPQAEWRGWAPARFQGSQEASWRPE